jgi:hypothetical protein
VIDPDLANEDTARAQEVPRRIGAFRRGREFDQHEIGDTGRDGKAERLYFLFEPGTPDIVMFTRAIDRRDIFQRGANGRIIGFVSRREERDLVYKKVG